MDLNQHTSLPVILRGKCVRDSERSAWQWFNMTVSLEWILTLRHFHGQELVPVRASGHKAEGLAKHSLEINTRRRADASWRAALKGVWFKGVKAARFLQNHSRFSSLNRLHEDISSIIWAFTVCFPSYFNHIKQYVCFPFLKSMETLLNIFYRHINIFQPPLF